MTLELTEPLQTALDARPAEPLRLVDPRTQQAYVLLRAELYDRVKSLLEQDRLTDDERRVILEGVWRRAGWDEPAMDDYAASIPGSNYEAGSSALPPLLLNGCPHLPACYT